MILDSITVQTLLKNAAVDFGASDTKRDSCKRYALSTNYNNKNIALEVENCAKTVYVKTINLKP